MEFYLFNPEHDMALASFSPYYKAPTEIIRMKEDLAGLPAWYADKHDCVGVFSANYDAAFYEQCVFSGLDSLARLVHVGEFLAQGLQNGLSACVPWGWDPALVQFLKTQRIGERFIPRNEGLNRIRSLSGRQQCVRVLHDFDGWPQVCGEAMVCPTLEAVKYYLEAMDEVILKAPWSGSGRGLVRTSFTTWTPNLEGWVNRILRTQGELMAEPIYNKVIDFAMEFKVDSSHQLSFVGYSLFETDSHGNYKANLLTSNQSIVSRLTHYVSIELLEKIKKQLLISIAELLNSDYVGYLGVDMMICKVTDSVHDEVKYKVHPCVEINLRMNMGVVARLLFDRYMSFNSEGSYIVEHYSKDGEALINDHELRKSKPSRVENGKMVEGYFPLTPVTTTTRYQCYVICSKIV